MTKYLPLRFKAILMDRYLPDHRKTVCGVRETRCQPLWYNDFVKAWRACMRELAMEARKNPELETLFNRQQRLYYTSPLEWWCGCLLYHSSLYHLCKHLVRFISTVKDPTGQQFVFQPFHRLVHRQTTSPLLWIEGFHEDDQRTQRGIFDDGNFWRPDAEELWHERQPNVQRGDEDDSESGSSSESSDDDSEGDNKDDVRRNVPEIVMREPHEDDDDEQLDDERSGEELKTHLRIFLDEIDVLRGAIMDMLGYDSSHRHLRELHLQVSNTLRVG
jgi:hypothetical protein